MKNIYHSLGLLILCFLFSNCDKPGPPVIETTTPDFGPAETLVVFEGENLGNIMALKFSDEIYNFNTAYNSDNALLLRIPENLPLGEHEVIIETEYGSATTNFRMTLDPPEIFRFEPSSADIGDEVVLYGENFFEPVTVYFYDSIEAEVISLAEDSIVVVVPEGVEKGSITVIANGGLTRSPVQFFSTRTILVNDFDGNGMRAETNKWIFIGGIDQNAATAVQNSNPAPIDENFLKLSGTDALNIGWIGGAENHSWDTDVFTNFGITTSNNNTLFEMDYHANGNENTHIIIIFLERDGSSNDFTHQVKVSGDEWEKISLPLNRFEDLNGILVDPAKIRTVKVHLIDADGVGSGLEINVDNIKFLEIL